MTEDLTAPHKCHFVLKPRAGAWINNGPIIEREWTAHFVCIECGRERPSRRPRAPSRLDQKVAHSAHSPVPDPDPNGRIVANAILRLLSTDHTIISARGLFGIARKSGIPASSTEQWAERFLLAGWIQLSWKLSGTARKLNRIEIVDKKAQDALMEYFVPGGLEAHRTALENALKSLRNVTHPVGQEIKERLSSSEAESYDPNLINALAAVALHVELGDTLAERVFAVHYLGHSKAVMNLRSKLERIIGPLEHLGIREGSALTQMGGQGHLFIGVTSIDLSFFHPFLGLPREMVEKIDRIELPAGGLFIVENMTVFEACCRGEVEDINDCLIIWSAGYPGRAVRAMVERSAACGARIRVWADLDLDGVRIARLIATWSPKGIEPYHMAPKDIEQAARWNLLPERMAKAIKRDLLAHPTEILSGTLEALLAANRWVEQEAQLGDQG